MLLSFSYFTLYSTLLTDSPSQGTSPLKLFGSFPLGYSDFFNWWDLIPTPQVHVQDLTSFGPSIHSVSLSSNYGLHLIKWVSFQPSADVPTKAPSLGLCLRLPNCCVKIIWKILAHVNSSFSEFLQHFWWQIMCISFFRLIQINCSLYYEIGVSSTAHADLSEQIIQVDQSSDSRTKEKRNESTPHVSLRVLNHISAG